MDQSHPDTECSVCEADPIIGVRIACLICKKYELCEECHQKKRFSKKHKPYHPVQIILPPDEFERSLEGVDQEEIRIFRCPCCGDDDFNVRELTDHCTKFHRSEHYLVHCPICVSQGWPSEQTKNVSKHLKRWHSDEDEDDLEEIVTNSSDDEGEWEDIESEDDKCCICQEWIISENCRKLPCDHSYHRTCINRWLKDNNNCPHCRAEVRE